MKKNKLIFLISFGLLAAACIIAFFVSTVITRNFTKEVFEQSDNAQKLTVKNLIIIETKENVKSWELSADTGSYNSGDQEAILTGVIGNFYKDNKVVVSFKASEASFNQETKKIVLTKNAVIIYEDGTYIEANEFEWEGNNKNIQARGNVRIVKPNEAILVGQSAYLSNQMTDFKIMGRTITKLFGEGKDIR